MISVKRWVKEFFGLSHSQANGFIVLIPLLVILIFAEPVWQWYMSQTSYDFSADQAKLDSLILAWEKGGSIVNSENGSQPSEAFFFDPNHITGEQFVKLGFSAPLINRIDRYRQKGGKFKVKSDLLKIYGMDSSLYQNLYAFIDLPVKIGRARSFEKQTRKYENKNQSAVRVIEKFDLNLADTSQLKKINGIGIKLSLRIIKYRDALGGFVEMEQLAEVYGLDSAVVGRLRQNSFIMKEFKPSQIHLNAADEPTLAAHPYLRKEVARSIVAYRFQHGRFQRMDDLRKIHAMDDKTFQKIAPYLTVDD